MGFHKRYINNQQVIDWYKSGGIENVKKWYTGKVDALITETGLASNIHSVLEDNDWQTFGPVKMNDHIINLILKEIGVEDPLT
jgi:hypothetical protein|tara:strand:+ start:1629 stop:1877 length:249 start_codon:yes stop_codon:yes gene_type:complete